MIKEEISQFLYRKYNTSFSQCAEDTILATLFCYKMKGFFVDIGAFHPYKFSNTYLFYRKGWNGINIDAAPGSMRLFNKLRPLDINLEIAISDISEKLTYYYLGEGNAMNTFSKQMIETLGNQEKIQKTIDITTQRLDSILDKYLSGKEINFMSIDVENLELMVLKSNNWDKYRPHVLLLESFELMNSNNDFDIPIMAYLNDKGYKLICKTINGIFFLRTDMSLNSFNHIVF